jgi:hypothetical protein
LATPSTRASSLALALFALHGQAQAQTGDAALAETLFRDAKALMQSGNFHAACPKLAESERLDPGTGTHLALAVCHEKEGKTASAWAEYQDVVTAAQKEGNAERVQVARTRGAVLEPKLLRITLEIGANIAETPGLTVRRDGIELGRAAWGTAMPVDAGVHTFEVSAPSHKPWSKTVEARAEEPSAVVRVSELELAPAANEPAPLADAPRPAPPREEAPTGGGTQRAAGIVTLSAGVVAVAMGTYFGVRAISKSDEAKSLCDPARCTDRRAVDINDEAKTSATVSTIAIGTGMLAAGVGVWLMLSAKGRPATRSARLSPAIDPRGGGLSLRGDF